MTEGNPERTVMFEFAQRLIDPQFRRALQSLGTINEQDVVVTVEDTPAVEVFGRIFKRAKPPALIAIRRSLNDLGFVFMMVRPDVHSRPESMPGPVYGFDQIDTIGKLYDALTGHEASLNVAPQWFYDVKPYVPESIAA